MTINERVSDERLSTLANLQSHECMALPAGHNEVAMMARELQQYRGAAEPVYQYQAFTFVENSDGEQEKFWFWSDCDERFYTACKGTKRILYAAPQVTSVPDVGTAHSSIIAEQLEHILSGMDVTDHQRAVIICAVDQLNKNAEEIQQKTAAPAVQAEQEPVSQPYTLPADYLQGHKDGCEWAARMAEADHPQTGDWLFDDPIELAKAIRKGPDMLPVEPGNSPAIPDGWIPVSERMPEPKSERRVCVYTPTPHEDMRYRFVPASLFKTVCSSATHWYYMEPPAAPKQGAE